MKHILNSAFFLFFTVTTAGCAIGPLVSHETARTVGYTNSEVLGGYGVGGYVFKFNYGLAENLDFGLHWESLSVGLRLKYAFINGKENAWSFAGAAGLGSSIGGSHYYGDLTASYLFKQFEPYGTFRYVHVKNDPIEFKDKDTGTVDFTADFPDYDYGQAILGFRFWFDKHWLASLEASSLFAFHGLTIGEGVLVGGAFGYHF
jgi:hypothetical protein